VIGASAAQSSTLQCFDAALGIIHEPGMTSVCHCIESTHA